MARVEQDREDIMREASALRPRAELRLPNLTENLVFGFRSSGGLSLFFGPDPVYQFNSAGELRRAFVDGKLYKADCARLQQLDRQREANQVTLWRSELTDADQAKFLETLHDQCSRLAVLLDSHQAELIEEIPKSSNAVAQLRAFLSKLGSPPKVADKPNAT